MWNRIRSHGAFLIVADPRRTPTAEHAHLHLPVRPGTDLPLLNAMLHVSSATACSTARSSSGTRVAPTTR